MSDAAPAPKPRTEATQESQERLEVLELDRTPRPEKMARETSFLAGASEVAYRERAFRPRQSESLDEIRRKVDAMAVGRRALPDVPELPRLPPLAPPTPSPFTEAQRAVLQPILPGPLLAVEPVYTSEGGDVVAAHYEEGGERRTRTFVLRHGTASPIDDLSRAVDTLPAPRAPAPPPPAPAPSPPAAEPVAPAPPSEPAKRKFGFPKLSLPTRKAAGSPPSAPEKPAEEKPKRRFGFGRK